MDRLWVRFSIAITLVLIFTNLLVGVQILLGPWLYPFSDEAFFSLSMGWTYTQTGSDQTDPFSDEAFSSLSMPLLDPADVDDLIETLSVHKFEWLDATIYADGFFSVSGVTSPDQVNSLRQTLQQVGVSESFDALSDTFFIEGQLPPEQVDRFINHLPVDELIIIDDPLLVENLSLVDIFQLLYEQVWQAIIISVILGIGLGIWLSRTLTSPISRLTETARAIGAKNLSRRVSVKGSKEVVELADTFNQMVADLEKGELLRRQMMADVSHELRTPLTGLESNLRAALDKVHGLEEEDLARLYSQTNHLIQLVNDLHEISLAEAGQLPLSIKSANLAELIEQTVAIFAPLAQEKNINLEYQFTTPLQPVMVDALRLRQILHNLLANAFRHTPNGGTITVTVSQNNTGSQISIKDTGEGISPDHITHIFDRFYRTDLSRNRESGGAGLGLAIAKAFIEAHAGTLNATSQGRNCGTTFNIILPLRVE